MGSLPPSRSTSTPFPSAFSRRAKTTLSSRSAPSHRCGRENPDFESSEATCNLRLGLAYSFSISLACSGTSVDRGPTRLGFRWKRYKTAGARRSAQLTDTGLTGLQAAGSVQDRSPSGGRRGSPCVRRLTGIDEPPNHFGVELGVDVVALAGNDHQFASRRDA